MAEGYEERDPNKDGQNDVHAFCNEPSPENTENRIGDVTSSGGNMSMQIFPAHALPMKQ